MFMSKILTKKNWIKVFLKRKWDNNFFNRISDEMSEFPHINFHSQIGERKEKFFFAYYIFTSLSRSRGCGEKKSWKQICLREEMRKLKNSRHFSTIEIGAMKKISTIVLNCMQEIMQFSTFSLWENKLPEMRRKLFVRGIFFEREKIEKLCKDEKMRWKCWTINKSLVSFKSPTKDVGNCQSARISKGKSESGCKKLCQVILNQDFLIDFLVSFHCHRQCINYNLSNICKDFILPEWNKLN